MLHDRANEMVAEVGVIKLTNYAEVQAALNTMERNITDIENDRTSFIVSSQTTPYASVSQGSWLSNEAERTAASAALHVVTSYVHLVETAFITLNCRPSLLRWETRAVNHLMTWLTKHKHHLKALLDLWFATFDT